MVHPKVVDELADRLFGSTTAQAVVLDVDRRTEDLRHVGDERKEPLSAEIVEAQLLVSVLSVSIRLP